MHGSQIFKDLFGKEQPVLSDEQKRGRGRSAHLIKKRDEALLLRYIWYGKNTKLRYDVILETLSEEFFLSPVRIYNIIQNNYKQLKKLSDIELSIPDLKKKFPHFNWN